MLEILGGRRAMTQRSASQRSALFAMIVAVMVVASTVGCADDPISPSLVTRLRILGLSPTPAEPSPGDQVTLELLWTDPPAECTGELDCPAEQSCQSGRCVRDDETVNVVWLVSRLAAWQSTESTATEGGFGGFLTSGIEIPGLGECSFDQESCSLSCGGIGDLSFWDLCTMACQGFEGSDISLCCGGAEAGQFNVTVPEAIEVPPPTCGGETSIDTSQVLQVQAQVCVGGRINLCDLDINSLSFGCEGEGAESVTALSRVQIAHDPAEANLGPVVERATWGRWQSTEVVGWSEETVVEVEGCLDSECTTRTCSHQGDCSRYCDDAICSSDYFDLSTRERIGWPAEQPRGATTCIEALCREEFSIALSSEAQETYLRACDEETSCEQDGDCGSNFVCDEGSCRRIENPVTAFYATDGLFTPGRVVLDKDGDGRPNVTRFRTRWLPPVLDECTTDADCYLGECIEEAGRCTLEVPLWIVARDGRGGQDWIERIIRVVPPRP